MTKSKIALGAVVGAVAGFVTGILVAPKSGKETREEIKNGALKTKDDVAVSVEKAKEMTREKTQEVKAKAGEIVDDVSSQATELKARTEQAVEGAKKGFSKKPKTAKK